MPTSVCVFQFCKTWMTHYRHFMTKRSTPVSAIIAILSATAVWADVPASKGLCDLALKLDAVVVGVTGDAPLTSCPEIGFAVPTTGDLARSQAGAYDPETGQINLAPDLDLTSIYGQSYLLHELVHAAQFRSDRAKGFACRAALEAEAYAIQADFLQNGGDMRQAVLMRLLAGQLGTCPTAEPDY